MHTDTQISRGLERILATNAGAYLEGLYGLSGFGSCETFGDLEDASIEAGVPNARAASRALRRAHKCACKRMSDAVPVAVAVQSALEEASGPGRRPFSDHVATLGGIGELLGATTAAKIAAKAQKAATKAAAKIVKINVKEAKQEAKVAAKVAKLQAAGKTAKANKVIAKDAKQDAKVAAKVVKLENVIAAANQAIQTVAPTVAPSTPVTPTEAAAAVLANQSQLPATPAVQQLTQEVVANATAPGSTIPSASLTTPATSALAPTPSAFGPSDQYAPSFQYPQGGGGGADYAAAPADAAESGGMFGNIPPLALAAGAAGLLFLLMPKKGRG